jgi:flagellar FliL protein
MVDDSEYSETEEDGDEPKDNDDEDDEGEGGPPKAQDPRKPLFIIAGVLVLAISTAYFMGMLDPVIEMVSGSPVTSVTSGQDANSNQLIFYELPEILVGLNSSGQRTKYLKLRVSLELPSTKDAARIEALAPRIISDFLFYLREVRAEELRGSAGMNRLREALLTRVSAAVAPAQIKNLLFKEMLLK